LYSSRIAALSIAGRHHHHRRTNAPIGPDAEKFRTAWTATVRGQPKEPLDGRQDAWRHAVGSNALQIEVTAARTMSVSGENGGHSASIKSKAAGMASPWLESKQPAESVHCAGAT
jgi:hypothetical protein